MTANALYIEKETRRLAREAEGAGMSFLRYLLEMAAEEATNEALRRESGAVINGSARANPPAAR